MRRNKLSVPAQYIPRDTDKCTVLDYGCGRGDDVRLLKEEGFRVVVGWDPAHQPKIPPMSPQIYDHVLMSYVLNVIEDPVERANALIKASALALKTIVIGCRISRDQSKKERENSTQRGDGWITAAGTFQWYGVTQIVEGFLDYCLDKQFTLTSHPHANVWIYTRKEEK